MASRWGNNGNSDRLYFGGLTADGDHSHETKRQLLLGRKVMTNLDSIFIEEGMATHFSILAWEIPRTEEFGGYSPWGPWGRKESDTTL